MNVFLKTDSGVKWKHFVLLAISLILDIITRYTHYITIIIQENNVNFNIINHIKQLHLIDYERYISFQHLSEQQRNSMYLLLSLNYELSLLTTEKNTNDAAMLTISWWKDLIYDKLEYKAAQDSLPYYVQKFVQDGFWSQYEVEKIITNRFYDVTKQPFENEQEFDEYALNSNGILFQTGLLLDDTTRDQADNIDLYRQAAQNIGSVWSMVGMLRSFYWYGSFGVKHIPQIFLDQHKIQHQDLLQYPEHKDVYSQWVQYVIEDKIEPLLNNEIKNQINALNKSQQQTLVIIQVAKAIMAIIREHNYDVLTAEQDIKYKNLPWVLLKARTKIALSNKVI